MSYARASPCIASPSEGAHAPDDTPPGPHPAASIRSSPAQVRRILRLFRPYRGRLALVGLLVGASSLVSVASPFLLREILDVAIPEGRTGLLTPARPRHDPQRRRSPASSACCRP